MIMIMVGNQSVHAIAIYTLALHATVISQRGVVAIEASKSFDDRYDHVANNNKRKHLRQGGGYPVVPEGGDDQKGDLVKDDSQRGRQQREPLFKVAIGSSAAQDEQQSSATTINFGNIQMPFHEAIDLGTDVSACVNRQWYQDFTNPQMACTNSLDYPPLWNDPSLKEIVMFSSSEDCCNSLIEFMGESYNNFNDDGPCLVIDECEESSSAVELTALPPTAKQGRRKLACGELGFHPTTDSDGRGCTNDNDFPPSWAVEPQLKSRMFHPVWEACCQFFFKGNYEDCPVKDICSGKNYNIDDKKNEPSSQQQNPTPVTKPTPSVTKPTPSATGTTTTGCTNKWHVDMIRKNGCSNDEFYPKEWLDSSRKHLMFFDTPEKCCNVMFNGKGCEHNNNGCGNVSTEGISNINNPQPPRPTPRPIFRGTYRPTPKPRVYWIEETTGTCVDEEDVPRPHWIDTTYSVYEACCMNARDSGACKNAKPVDPNRPTKPPIMKPFSFYVDPSTGMCVEESEMTKPTWVETTYPVYDFCCNKDDGVRDREVCMKARPTMINGISFGTLSPTATPEPKYYADPGSGMCVSEATTPKPSHVAMTFDTFSRCCMLASSNPETCLTGEHLEESTSDSETSTSSPTPSPPPDYYLQQDSAICVDRNSVQNAGWVGETFGTDYNKCCNTSWNKQKCIEMKPSLPPTEFPTPVPSTPWPTYAELCPEPYDPTGGDYDKGSEVEVNLVLYRCISHSVYCNKITFRPPQTDPGAKITAGSQTSGVIINPPTNDEKSGTLWEGAWERVAICEYPPSPAPSGIPTTPGPTCEKAQWHPEAFDRRICTNGFGYPALWDEPPLSETYFVGSAEECCNKFYGGKRCRIKDVCS